MNSLHTVVSVGGEFLTAPESIVRQWNEYFKNLLDPTNKHSEEKAEPEDFKLGSLITGAVKQHCSRSTPGVDEIRPKLLKVLDVVGLS